MRVVKVLSALGLLAMTAALIYGFTVGNFRSDGSKLLQNPWGVVSLVDLYIGFTLFSLWIIYREKSPTRSLLWVVLMMVLGFFTASLYSLLAAYSSAGDWRVFWMGRRADG
jgi:RsiW-degrading membrane proteinase PrsW (M82 family)